MKIVDTLGYYALKAVTPRKFGQGTTLECQAAPVLAYMPKIRRIIGEEGWKALKDKTILDFGCGMGNGAIEMAQHGARHVIGVDIRQEAIETAKERAAVAGLSSHCTFTDSIDTQVDAIVTMDAFEHFSDPKYILDLMHGLLRQGGRVIISFGPTWLHPRGGHFFSIFPWSHLLFSERAQIRWRSAFRSDGATTFGEVEGGLNRMTIRRFVRLVSESGFSIAKLKPVPIRPLRLIHNRLTREFTTAVVDCLLVRT